MALDQWRSPALVIVDMQNDFVREGAPMEVPDARATVPRHRRLIDAFRKAERPVVYTRFLAGPSRTLVWAWSPALAPPTMACRRGHERYYPDLDRTLECAGVIDEIRPEPGDPIIDKYGYGGFHATVLDGTLRSLAVESLVITGTVTQICVEETGREAFHHGYRATLVSDAVSSYEPDLHAATLRNFALKFGWVASTEEVIAALGTRPAGG